MRAWTTTTFASGMCRADKTPLLVLYGSQTGNSRAMAKELGDEALAKGYDARVLGMEKFKTLDFEEVPLLVLVTSTTGNGDAPDNADGFLRYCKRRSTPSVFTKTKYAIFGLGDSNYEAFCEVPKLFDEHLLRLGGTKLLKRCDADEVEGLESFFDPWKTDLWSALEKAGSVVPPDAEAEKLAAAAPAPAPAPIAVPTGLSLIHI